MLIISTYEEGAKARSWSTFQDELANKQPITITKQPEQTEKGKDPESKGR